MVLDVYCKNIYFDNSDEEKEAQIEDDDFEDDEPDFMDNSGKCWEFGTKIVDEKHLKEWCQNKMGGMIVGKEEKLTRQFHCQIKQCQFKAIFLKSCSTIYTRNKHNHGVENVKNSQEKAEVKVEKRLKNAPQNKRKMTKICEYCCRKFASKSNLNRHLRIHTNEKPYSCNWLGCGKKFTDSSNCIRHEQKHLAENKFVCKKCGRDFKRSDHLARHRRQKNACKKRRKRMLRKPMN